MSGITQETVFTFVRQLVREIVLAIRSVDEDNGTGAPLPPPLDLSPYDMRGYARYALEEAGRPMHVREMAKRLYELGFKHRRQPTDPRQLESSLNSLASPSRYPGEFVRVKGKGRTLTLAVAS
jgi:hypothetical protein